MIAGCSGQSDDKFPESTSVVVATCPENPLATPYYIIVYNNIGSVPPTGHRHKLPRFGQLSVCCVMVTRGGRAFDRKRAQTI